MKICVAQTKPIRGNIERNIENHKKFIDQAISYAADAVIFPELSLTGYEPTLAKELATNQEDPRFADFQKISNSHQLMIGVGVPTKNLAGICISLVLFQPHKARLTYSKAYLHPDEEQFFVAQQSFPGLRINNTHAAIAICYELSVPAHAQRAYKIGAEIYIASVAKTARGTEQASKRLAEIAHNYSMTVLLSNCVGQVDDFNSAGKSSIWNHKGSLVGQLDDTNEGILIFDTVSQLLHAKTL